jgi:hypothetical protein
MNDQISMTNLAARIAGLRDAMDAVMKGTTPDHGKWSGVNSFVRTYSELAQQYNSLSRGGAVKVYDSSKLKGWADTVWPQQKSIFDAIYMDTLILLNLASQAPPPPPGPIYNLIVGGSDQEWAGKPFQIELSRCIREYTSPHLTNRYGHLDANSILELKRAPCIFACEIGSDRPPKFGYIKDIVSRQNAVRIDYEIFDVDPFVTSDDIVDLSFELDIGKLELYRTHWAVKEVNLPKELHGRGISLPSSVRDVSNAVDVSIHVFDVALSFPGEVRPLVEEIAHELERKLGPNSYFYDNNYVSQLARPSLDTLLQSIYSRSKLDVVFLSADYNNKDWCGVEFRAIREIIFKRENSRVMFVKTDDGIVDGIFKTDGYIDARKFDPSKISDFICERLSLLNQSKY